MPKGHGDGSRRTQFKRGRSGNPERAFKPGQTGNRGGRPKGFAAKIKELCGDDYGKIAQGFYLVAYGTPDQRVEFFGETVRVSAKDRIAAMIALRDSGPGRPVQTMTTDDGDTVAVPGSVQFVFRKAGDGTSQS